MEQRGATCRTGHAGIGVQVYSSTGRTRERSGGSNGALGQSVWGYKWTHLDGETWEAWGATGRGSESSNGHREQSWRRQQEDLGQKAWEAQDWEDPGKGIPAATVLRALPPQGRPVGGRCTQPPSRGPKGRRSELGMTSSSSVSPLSATW